MKLVFIGSGAFGIPSLKALADSSHKITLVVSQPDQPAGRKKTLAPPPLAAAARELGLPLFQPRRINQQEVLDRLRREQAELFVVVSYGQILKPALLDLPSKGCLNVHGSLLPRHRGASPVQAAILAGDRETGATLMVMDEGLDTGPVLRQISTPLGPRETGGELADRLGKLAPSLLIEGLRTLGRGELAATPQDESQASSCHLISKEEGRLCWEQAAVLLERRIRAFYPWPGAFTFWKRGGERSQRLLIEEALPVEGQGPPGQVLEALAGRLVVAAGQGALRILRLKPAGKDSMDAAAFLRGHALGPGDRLEKRP